MAALEGAGSISIRVVPDYRPMVEAFREIAKAHQALAADAASMAGYFESKMVEEAQEDDDGR
jgi:hypothetical protein